MDGTKVDVVELKLQKGKISETKTETLSGKEKKAMCITSLGLKTNEYLINNFTKILDYKFTNNIENDLDKVANGSVNNNNFKTFYNHFI